jgi:osmotically-inducible protein OsmY
MAQSSALVVPPDGQQGDEEKDASKANALLAAQSLLDRCLVERVERALRATGYSPLRSVEASVCGRLVILQGQVPSYYLKQLAQATAMDVPGVRELRNDVEVVRSQDASEESSQGAPNADDPCGRR